MKILFIIILIYFALMLLGKYILPFMVKGYVKHYTKKFYDDMEDEKKNSARKVGKVNITESKGKRKKLKDEEGEFVDYEEIK